MKTLKTRINEIEEIAQNPAFIALAASVAKQLKITPKEWEENKAVILLRMAIECPDVVKAILRN